MADGSKESDVQSRSGDGDEIELLDGDITKSLVNGILAINFSERVNRLLIEDMATTVVLKLFFGTFYWI